MLEERFLPPLPSHQRMEAYGERRTNTICNALIFPLAQVTARWGSLEAWNFNNVFFDNFVQTFRNYREVFEDQKAAIEQRYRTLLEEAIQDAVFLSTRNQELMHENQVLKQGNETTTLWLDTDIFPYWYSRSWRLLYIIERFGYDLIEIHSNAKFYSCSLD